MQRLLTLASMIMVSGLSVALCSSCSSPIENPQPYPNRPVEVIVPFAPGGGSDTFARIIKAEIDEQQLLPHPLVIINAPGAGGTIGSRRVMNEKPDGYTVLLLHDAILTARHSGNVLYGPSAFEQVAGTGRSGMVIAVHEDSPYDTLPDLLEAAATQPDSVTFAANLGAPSHFIGLIVEQEHGTAEFRFAQSGGGADRFAAIKGKHAETTAFSLEEFLRFKPDGIKALAYLGQERHNEVPDLATAIEQGINVKQSVMQYWWMPKGSPPAHVERFAEVLKRAMNSENVQAKLSSMKIDPVFIAGDELTEHLIETDAALAEVDPGTDSPLPNVPLVLAGLTLLFGAAVAVQRMRKVREPTSETALETAAEAALETTTSQLLFSRWSIVAVSAALVLTYALCTIVCELPLGIVTTLFLMAMGFLLSMDARKTKPWIIGGLIVVSSFVVGIVFHLVFTRLFEIGL